VGELTDLLPVILVALLLWLLGLSLAFYKNFNHYRRLIKKASGGSLVSAMEALLDREEQNSASVKSLRSEITLLRESSVLPLQKVGLVKFSPFGEMGGDQSFSLCLLNGVEDGVLLTALHTRDRTRVYTKSVVKGESKYELSKEELKALKEAQKVR